MKKQRLEPDWNHPGFYWLGIKISTKSLTKRVDRSVDGSLWSS